MTLSSSADIKNSFSACISQHPGIALFCKWRERDCSGEAPAIIDRRSVRHGACKTSEKVALNEGRGSAKVLNVDER